MSADSREERKREKGFGVETGRDRFTMAVYIPHTLKIDVE